MRSVLSIGYVSSVRMSSVKLPLPFVRLALLLLLLPGLVEMLLLLLLLLLIKLIFLLIVGLIGVNGSVPPSLPLLLVQPGLLLLPFALVFIVVGLCVAFGEVAGVRMPKFTRLGSVALPPSSAFPFVMRMFVLFMDDILWVPASATNLIILFGFRADDIA